MSEFAKICTGIVLHLLTAAYGTHSPFAALQRFGLGVFCRVDNVAGTLTLDPTRDIAGIDIPQCNELPLCRAISTEAFFV